MPVKLTRREFVHAAGGVTAAGVLGCSPSVQPVLPPDDLVYATLRSRPRQRTENVRRGLQPLRLGSGRDGFLYVPSSYSPDRATPLVVLLHGAGRDSSDWSSPRFAGLFDNPPIIVIAPDSRRSTWDVLREGYGPDVGFIDEALDLAFGMCNVDPKHLALGGFSDGASYALSLGMTNGDLFTALMAFSPGFSRPAAKRGKPRIFVAHGRQDQILAIDATQQANRAITEEGRIRCGVRGVRRAAHDHRRRGNAGVTLVHWAIIPFTLGNHMQKVTEARPADVASPEAIVTAVYEVLSGGAGEARDWDRWRPLYAPSARLIPIEEDSDGASIPRVLSPEEYIASRNAFLAAGDFYEWETRREELRSGSIAHVWSLYEAARTPGGEAIRRGANSIQLWNDGSRWWILSVVWDAVNAAALTDPD